MLDWPEEVEAVNRALRSAKSQCRKTPFRPWGIWPREHRAWIDSQTTTCPKKTPAQSGLFFVAK